ncbi:MAG: 4-alpha-glucanotransferase [Bacteroidaceae bacterium]|nr:4-alpha-glucanotransferase [Bacteroidaceae bacterium]
MKFHFSIEYRTEWGQQVGVEISRSVIGGKCLTEHILLDTQDGLIWKGEVFYNNNDTLSFTYQYVIFKNGAVVRREWNTVPRTFNASSNHVFIFSDSWRDIPLCNHMYSSAYTHCNSNILPKQPIFAYFEKTFLFRVQAPQLLPGQILALVGSLPQLGGWEPRYSLRMASTGINEWSISISAEGVTTPFEYKYVILDELTGNLVTWEEGTNRCTPNYTIEPNRIIVLNDNILHVSEDRWRVAGVVVPVFSLRSEKSQGVGDFGDLRGMVDWASQAGMHVIQLLPIYDTTQLHTDADSYPYNSISIYALHPMYVDIRQLPVIEDEAFMQEYEKDREAVNAAAQMQYAKVNALKQRYLRRLYQQQASSLHSDPCYLRFCQKNDDWLIPYGVFCLLRDEYGTCDFNKWPQYSEYDASEVLAFAKSHQSEVGFYVFVQYLLDRQLSSAIEYAHQQKVVFKGDIPIGISRYSVEAWSEPYYFHMNSQAGAPPDVFSKTGQNWGFPTYNWERMAQDGYRWWVRRLQKMADYFDAYRIDHVLGFFRIWQIPLHSIEGLLGCFSPSLPMSADEIERYGLRYRYDFFIRPYITDDVLTQIFGSEAEKVVDSFLRNRGDGTYDLKEEFSTQRKVSEYFANISDEHTLFVRNGLFKLINNVLFIADAHRPELLHPRIAVQDDTVFQALSPDEKEAFNKLYEHYFYERHNDYWYSEAMKKLPVLTQSTRMLVCAEDLGMVPSCVMPVLDKLKILSLEIQTMPKAFGQTFARLEDNPYRSVATIFTHDMPTLRGWWKEDYQRAQRYYNQVLQHQGFAPEQISGALCEEVVERHLASPSMLCLISLQDWLSIDESIRFADCDAERINIPANPKHYWGYRMHLTIEELVANTGLSSHIRNLITNSGRT